MIHIFNDNFSYIDYITKNGILDGEVMCTSYLPSAFFTKDTIDFFFDKKEYIPKHKIASEKLWEFGRQVLKALKTNFLEIGIETDAIKCFVEDGRIHKATENFEVSLNTRISVIDSILANIENIFFLSEPTPYVFRLIPPDIIILDVDKNKTQQTIQGIKLQDELSFKSFAEEFSRLKKTSHDKQIISNLLKHCKTTLKAGTVTKFRI